MLEADSASDPQTALSRQLVLGAVPLARFRRNWSLTDSALAGLLAEAGARRIGDHAVSEASWQRWRKEVLAFIEARHQADPSLAGLKISELPAVPFLEALTAELVAESSLTQEAGRFRPSGHEVSLSDSERRWFERIRRLLDQPQPPSLGDMARQMRLSPPELARQLNPLVAKKLVVRISDSRYYLPERLGALADLAEQLAEGGPFTVRQYRDTAAIGRNVAIEVLEYFDARGFTRRDGDTRRVVGRLAL